MAIIPYHRIVPIAQALYDRIQNQSDGEPFRKQAEILRDHYIGGDGYKEYAHLHAALCFLVSKDTKEARNKICEERLVTVEGARNILLKAVNAGPGQWLCDTEYFYAKGLIYSGKRYYTVPDDLVKGSLYDQIARAVPKDYQPVLMKALEIRLARPTKGESTGMPTMGLIYTAIQLLDEKEKAFRMNAMSAEKTPRSHRENLGLSYDIIQSACKELGLAVPKDLLGEHAVRRPQRGSAPTSKILTKSAGTPFKEAQSAQKAPMPEDDGDDGISKLLYQKLKLLKDSGKITSDEAIVYYYLKSTPKNWSEIHTAETASVKWKRPLSVTLKMVDTVESALSKMESNSSLQPSKTDLHQSSAVRP